MPDILDVITQGCKALNLDWALIGGLALPSYGVTRTTYDLDVAVYFKSEEELAAFVSDIERSGVRTLQKPKLNHLVFVIFSEDPRDEAEIWLTPCDAFPWDDEIIKRIHAVEGDPNTRTLSVEDFIMTKMARLDRSAIDLQDILQILLAQQQSIQWDYLLKRVTKLNLNTDLVNIISLIQEKNSTYYVPPELLGNT